MEAARKQRCLSQDRQRSERAAVSC